MNNYAYRVDPSLYPTIVEQYNEGWSLRELGSIYGVSYEAIRLILKKVQPNAEERRRALHKQWDIEEAFIEACQRALDDDHRCVVCGGWVLRHPDLLTCTSDCSQAWKVLRTLPEFSNEHRIALAKSVMRNQWQYPKSRVAWAEAMLSDNPPEPNRRFFREGSARAEIVRKYAPEIYEAVVKKNRKNRLKGSKDAVESPGQTEGES